MKTYIKALIVAVSLLVAGVLVSPSAQVQIQRGFSYVASMTVADFLIFGTPDTSGVRLDLESGSLAVREGDDSAYAPLLALSVGINGATITSAGGGAGGVLGPEGTYFGFLNRGRINPVSSAAFQFLNNGATNTYDITLADWGTTLSAEGVSMADAAVASLGSAPLGKLVIAIGTDNNICEFELRGSSNAAVEVRDAGGVCSIAAATASSVNVYWDAGDSRYEIENLRGGARVIRAVLIGG